MNKINKSLLLLWFLAAIALTIFLPIFDPRVYWADFEDAIYAILDDQKELIIDELRTDKQLVDEIPIWLRYHPKRLYNLITRDILIVTGAPNSSVKLKVSSPKGNLKIHINYMDSMASVLTIYHTPESTAIANSIKTAVQKKFFLFPVVPVEKNIQ